MMAGSTTTIVHKGQGAESTGAGDYPDMIRIDGNWAYLYGVGALRTGNMDGESRAKPPRRHISDRWYSRGGAVDRLA